MNQQPLARPMTLLDQLRRDEGTRYTAYSDPVGIATIGCGHRLDLPISDAAVDQILRDDIGHAMADCAQLPCWGELTEPRRGALVNMCFNVGFGGLMEFHKFLAALDAGDYERAAAEMLDSRWARQTKDRAVRLAVQMRTNEWT